MKKFPGLTRARAGVALALVFLPGCFSRPESALREQLRAQARIIVEERRENERLRKELEVLRAGRSPAAPGGE